MQRVLLALLPLVVACSPEYDIRHDTDDVNTPDDDEDTGVLSGPQPDIKLDPPTIGFGWLAVDCPSAPQTVTVTNVGEAELEVYDLTLSGAAAGSFEILGASQNLQPQESFTFEVMFTPGSIADFDAVARVTSNDPDEANADVDLVGHGSEDTKAEDIFVQPSPEAVDVLWVIDNSCSMSGTITSLGNELDTFINQFVMLGLDYQLGVVTTDMDAAAHQGQLQGAKVISPSLTPDVISAFKAASNQGSSGSGDERGRDAAYAALTEPLLSSTNAGFVRPGAHLAVVVVSDEEDSSRNISTTDFSNWLNAYKGDPDKTSFSGMVGPRAGSSGWFPDMTCAFGGGSVAEATKDYPAVIDATGGLHTDLCDMDFKDVLTYLSYYAAGLTTTFELSQKPTGVSQIKVKVNGVSVNYNAITGFTYDAATNSITFHGSSIPGPEAEVVVTYPVASEC